MRFRHHYAAHPTKISSKPFSFPFFPDQRHLCKRLRHVLRVRALANDVAESLLIDGDLQPSKPHNKAHVPERQRTPQKAVGRCFPCSVWVTEAVLGRTKRESPDPQSGSVRTLPSVRQGLKSHTPATNTGAPLIQTPMMKVTKRTNEPSNWDLFPAII